MRWLAPAFVVICLPHSALAQKSQAELQAKIQEMIKKGVPGASTKVALYQEAQALYEEYLAQYPGATDIVEARFGYAEVLFRMGELGDKSKWPSAAKQYQEVLIADTKNTRGADAALGVLVTTEKWAGGLPQTQEMSPEAQAIIAVYQDLYTRVAALPKSQATSDIGGQCAFRLGELYERYQQDTEALQWYQKGLTEYPTSSSEEATATQTLVLLFEKDQTEPLLKYIEQFRKDPELSKNKAFVDALSQLEAQLGTKSCLDAFEQKSWLVAAKCFEAAYPKAAIEKQPEYLFNSAVSYKKAEQPLEALRVFQLLLTKFPKAKEYQPSLLQVGYASLALLDVDTALSSFDEYAKRYPTDKELERVLQDIAVLRLASLQYEEAAQALSKKASLLEKTRPEEANDLYYDIAVLRDKQGDLDKIQSAWEQLLKRRGISAANVANAYAGLGDVFWKRGKKPDAEKQCKQAISLAEKSKEDAALNEESLSRCAFYLGELKVQQAESFAPPKVFDEKKVQAWLTESRSKLEEARAALNRVKDYGATTWALGALFRAGEMSMAHAKHIESLSKSTKKPEEEALIKEQLSPYITAYLKDAETAWSTCAQGVSLVRNPGEWLAQCEEKLYGLNPELYPMQSEWIAPPTAEIALVFAPSIVVRK
jgi:TolA-binding protein